MSAYVALDGPDGCGKTTQTAALVEWLRAGGHTVQHVREPGSTPVGEALRELLLSPDTGELRAISEALLFSAARAELVARVIRPALQRGEVVVAERCFLSTAVYQVLAGTDEHRGALEPRWFDDLTRRVHGDCLPQAIFVLDLPAEAAAHRRRARHADRIEARGPAYHDRVRQGFVTAARREPRARLFDASRSFGEVQAALRAAMTTLLGAAERGA